MLSWICTVIEKTSKCVKKINDTLGCASCATSLFLPRFDVMCYVLLNRSTATWSAFLNIYCSIVQIWYRSPCLPLFFFFFEEEILLVDLRALGAEI